MYELAARLVVAVHLAFIAFLFLGGLAFASRRWLIWPHGLCVIYALLAMGGWWWCPLTLLEQSLLEKAGLPVYSGEFLPNYFWTPLGLTGAEPYLITAVLCVLVAVNYSAYSTNIRAERARRAGRTTTS